MSMSVSMSIYQLPRRKLEELRGFGTKRENKLDRYCSALYCIALIALIGLDRVLGMWVGNIHGNRYPIILIRDLSHLQHKMFIALYLFLGTYLIAIRPCTNRLR